MASREDEHRSKADCDWKLSQPEVVHGESPFFVMQRCGSNDLRSFLTAIQRNQLRGESGCALPVGDGGGIVTKRGRRWTQQRMRPHRHLQPRRLQRLAEGWGRIFNEDSPRGWGRQGPGWCAEFRRVAFLRESIGLDTRLRRGRRDRAIGRLRGRFDWRGLVSCQPRNRDRRRDGEQADARVAQSQAEAGRDHIPKILQID
jgi:hypothetical protein